MAATLLVRPLQAATSVSYACTFQPLSLVTQQQEQLLICRQDSIDLYVTAPDGTLHCERTFRFFERIEGLLGIPSSLLPRDSSSSGALLLFNANDCCTLLGGNLNDARAVLEELDSAQIFTSSPPGLAPVSRRLQGVLFSAPFAVQHRDQHVTLVLSAVYHDYMHLVTIQGQSHQQDLRIKVTPVPLNGASLLRSTPGATAGMLG